jgi:hypothetical protein
VILQRINGSFFYIDGTATRKSESSANVEIGWAFGLPYYLGVELADDEAAQSKVLSSLYLPEIPSESSGLYFRSV